MALANAIRCRAVLAGYIRVSHVGGRKVLRSPDDQRQEIERWAASRGHSVEVLEPELDAKGSDAARPIFRQAIEGVKSGTYSGVVVAYLSRAGRDLRLMLDLWDEVESAGGVVYSARENIDGSTPAGRLHRNLLASINQHELEERREGFAHARRAAVELGIWQRRQTPRGYDRDPETRGLVPNDQADSVAAAARDVLAGASLVKVATELGITPSGLRYLLRNRVYIGELRVGEHVNAQAHEPILDRETFAALQALLGQRTRKPRKGPPALLSGIVRCASCGHVMTRGTSKGVGYSYICPRHHSGVRCPAPVAIAAARLEPYVEAIALREIEQIQLRASAGDAVNAAQAAVEAARAELGAYLAAVDAAGIGAGDAADGMRLRRERVDEATAALEREQARAPQIPKIIGGREAWEALNGHERNQLLRSLLSAVIVRRSGRGRTVAVSERCRVLRYGADLDLPANSGELAGGIVPLWDAGRDHELGVPSGENPT